ncbi:MAG TPA: hypothetical protein O0X40_04590 [Methanocorpusculum sp.]|nr:hypothetical protein [Methanocorpusculum sp.]
MRIKGVTLHISPIVLAIFAFFVILFIVSTIATGDKIYVIWGIPLSLLLLILPLVSSYNLGSQYKKLLPEYEESAVPHKIRNVNLGLQGHAVRVEGVVQKIQMKWLGRPRYTIFDGSASIIVFRSLLVDEPIVVGDNIVAVGMVVKKYAIAGAVSIHGVGIKKVDNLSEIELDEDLSVPKKQIKIKKYN